VPAAPQPFVVDCRYDSRHRLGEEELGEPGKFHHAQRIFDPERWFQTMSTLSTFNRNSFSPGLAQARDWILQRFGEAELAASSHDFMLSNTSCSPAPPPVQLQNPIGIKLGRVQPERWIVVGAHYDSRNSVRCDGSASPQPGANDNASGCAGVIELARAFQDIATEKSIVFACFAGEEQGLVGAYAWVQSLADSGQLANVEHMINLDMIAHATNDLLDTRIETTTAFQGEFARYRAAGCDLRTRAAHHRSGHAGLLRPLAFHRTRHPGDVHLGKRRRHLPALSPVHRPAAEPAAPSRPGRRHPEDGRRGAQFQLHTTLPHCPASISSKPAGSRRCGSGG
jgi:hypothetical protein